MHSSRFRLVGSLVRLALALVFIVSGLAKLADQMSFLGMIFAYRLPLPGVVLSVAAISLPWFELFVGLSLVTGFWIETGLFAAFCLSLLFVAISLQAIVRGYPADCGCFGPLSEKAPALLKSPVFALVRNVLLAAATCALNWSAFSAKSPANGSQPE